jgi:hypothetical protein
VITPEDFDSFVQAIADANKLSIETAGDYAARIGDTPEIDPAAAGVVAIVRDDNGAEIARITLPEDAS